MKNWEDFFWDRPFHKELNAMQGLMRTDIVELAQGYEFKIELPGWAKEDITLSIDNGYLTVAAQKHDQPEAAHGNYLRQERVASACSRSFYVGNIDESAINASLEQGILTINLPKEAKPTRKQITIK